jgi:hypothetical protein
MTMKVQISTVIPMFLARRNTVIENLQNVLHMQVKYKLFPYLQRIRTEKAIAITYLMDKRAPILITKNKKTANYNPS